MNDNVKEPATKENVNEKSYTVNAGECAAITMVNSFKLENALEKLQLQNELGMTTLISALAILFADSDEKRQKLDDLRQNYIAKSVDMFADRDNNVQKTIDELLEAIRK